MTFVHLPIIVYIFVMTFLLFFHIITIFRSTLLHIVEDPNGAFVHYLRICVKAVIVSNVSKLFKQNIDFNNFTVISYSSYSVFPRIYLNIIPFISENANHSLIIKSKWWNIKPCLWFNNVSTCCDLTCFIAISTAWFQNTISINKIHRHLISFVHSYDLGQNDTQSVPVITSNRRTLHLLSICLCTMFYGIMSKRDKLCRWKGITLNWLHMSLFVFVSVI
jgi:hypothetical protein